MVWIRRWCTWLVLGALLLSACGAPEKPFAEPAVPTGGQPGIPHKLQGRDNCLMCHVVGSGGVGESGGTGMPDGHEGRTADVCRDCHSAR